MDSNNKPLDNESNQLIKYFFQIELDHPDQNIDNPQAQIMINKKSKDIYCEMVSKIIINENFRAFKNPLSSKNKWKIFVDIETLIGDNNDILEYFEENGDDCGPKFIIKFDHPEKISTINPDDPSYV